MKANRKFVTGDDEAVSPVIAVILMVAITVVLAATVYVWVSGFGSQSGQPAKTISLSSAAPLDTTNFRKDYTVASATSGMKYSDIKLTMDGVDVTCSGTGAPTGTSGAFQWSSSADGGSNWRACTGASAPVISAGELIRIDSDATFSGKTLRILDQSANSVILTLVVG